MLLCEVAGRIRSCVREDDLVARLGGDEFIVLLDGLSTDPSRAVARVQAVCEQILSAIDQPFQHRRRQFSDDGEHRRGAVPGRRSGSRRGAEARRSRDVRGEGSGARKGALLPGRDAGRRRRPAGADLGPAAGARRRAPDAALPAAGRQRRPLARRGGADPVEPSDARADQRGGVHPARRAERLHGDDRQMGSGECLRDVEELGRRSDRATCSSR